MGASCSGGHLHHRQSHQRGCNQGSGDNGRYHCGGAHAAATVVQARGRCSSADACHRRACPRHVRCGCDELQQPRRSLLHRAETNDSTIFNALTLLVVLGTSLITQLAGLSLALGAFLAGLLLAETEYHLQVRFDAANQRVVKRVAGSVCLVQLEQPFAVSSCRGVWLLRCRLSRILGRTRVFSWASSS